MCAQGIPEKEPCAGGIQQVFWGSQSRGSRSFRISPRDGRAEDVVCADGRPHPAKVSARATARSDRRLAHDGQSKEKSRAFRPGICVGRNSHAFGCGGLSFALCGKAFLPPLLRGQCGRALPPFPSLRIQSLFSRLNQPSPAMRRECSCCAGIGGRRASSRSLSRDPQAGSDARTAYAIPAASFRRILSPRSSLCRGLDANDESE